jgi:hypothetical protein
MFLRDNEFHAISVFLYAMRRIAAIRTFCQAGTCRTGRRLRQYLKGAQPKDDTLVLKVLGCWLRSRSVTLSFGSGQLNLVVPSNATSGPLTVSCDGTQVWAFKSLLVATVMPGLFTSSLTGSGQAASINLAGGAVNRAGNPVSRGDFITLYGTGFGNYHVAAANGLRQIPGGVTATIGGVTTDVEYIGESP